MKPTTVIYCLCEPGTKIIRYIGKTDGPLKYRLAEHLCDPGPSHKVNWVKLLRQKGQKPDVHLLCVVPRNDFARYERAFIAVARKAGLDLTNMLDGGEGTSGRVVSLETRAKLSAAALGRKASLETKAKRAAALTGAKNPMFGKKRSAESRAKQSASIAGEKHPWFGRRHSSASKTKMRASRFGKKHTPETCAYLKKIRVGMHQGLKRSGASSKFLGVSRDKHAAIKNPWRTQVNENGKRICLGFFSCEEAAAKAYDSAVLKIYGASAKLNFPL